MELLRKVTGRWIMLASFLFIVILTLFYISFLESKVSVKDVKKNTWAAIGSNIWQVAPINVANPKKAVGFRNMTNSEFSMKITKALPGSTIDRTQKGSSNVQIPKTTDNSGSSSANGRMVLILGYLRSGSTLTADIIQQSPEVFYLFEPFMFYLLNEYYSMGVVCNITFGHCRKPEKKIEDSSIVMESLEKLFKCDFMLMDNVTIRALNVTSHLSHEQKELMQCFRNRSRESCLLEFENKCKSSTRVIKVIRFTADLMFTLLRKFPNFKIIHLMRDPRGTISSRQEGGFGKNSDIIAHAQEICRRYVKDMDVMKKFHKQFSGRLKSILYEELAEHTIEAAKSLYNFIGLNFTSSVEKWINNNTHAQNDAGFYETRRKNSSETAYRWRYILKFGDIEKIDNQCTEFYKRAGYIRVSFETRTYKSDFGNYLVS